MVLMRGVEKICMTVVTALCFSDLRAQWYNMEMKAMVIILGTVLDNYKSTEKL
jgi:hypothetical protein